MAGTIASKRQLTDAANSAELLVQHYGSKPAAAEAAGVSENTIWRLRRGEENVSETTCDKIIAAALKIQNAENEPPKTKPDVAGVLEEVMSASRYMNKARGALSRAADLAPPIMKLGLREIDGRIVAIIKTLQTD